MPGEHLAILGRLSRVLYEDALRHPEWLQSVDRLDNVLTADQFSARQRPGESLAHTRRRELMRIVVRDGLKLGSLEEITSELSNLADALITSALHRCAVSSNLAVIALGKLGGCELNYSSDIDLMFVGDCSDRKLPGEVVRLLSEYTESGAAYRVDLRLRPEGALGELCLSAASAQTYYSTRARDWELQMFIKARVCAGHRATGETLLRSVQPLIYSHSIDLSAIEAISFAREQWNDRLARSHLRERGINVKFAPGGIRDIEFLVQCLQRLHGARDPAVREGSTLRALHCLHDRGLLSGSEFQLLTDAYTFLREVEHRLQLAEDRQVHTVPDAPDNAQLLRELTDVLEDVRSLYRRIIHAQRSLPPNANAAPGNADAAPSQRPAFSLPPFLAELLIQHPEYEADLQREAEHPTRRWVFEGMTAPLNDIDVLRRFFRREMFRIQVASVRNHDPIFQILDATSALAEFVIARAYRIAREQSLAHARLHATASKPFGEPVNDMSVVALGRLGMREFDLGSDADLVFIIPDSESERQPFWTRVAAHLIEILAAYTGEPSVLAIDSRLRPYGREGTLVQTESKYVEYFGRDAEAWEGMAYMKARGVAGDTERTTEFLVQLQRVDWRRYGQGGRSKQDLRQMRLRLQREIGVSAPLKAGEGAYYDADFILMYLRLKGAGLFFKSLNTPERIDIVEKMGHLESSDANLLLESTSFFRALDHAIRVVMGRREGKLPADKAARQMVAELVNRWTGESGTVTALEDRVGGVQARVRRLFNAVFH